MNGLLRESWKGGKQNSAKTPPRLAQAQFDRIARTLDSWKTSRFCDLYDRADREQVSLRDAAYRSLSNALHLGRSGSGHHRRVADRGNESVRSGDSADRHRGEPAGRVLRLASKAAASDV